MAKVTEVGRDVMAPEAVPADAVVSRSVDTVMPAASLQVHRQTVQSNGEGRGRSGTAVTVLPAKIVRDVLKLQQLVHSVYLWERLQIVLVNNIQNCLVCCGH